MVVELVSSSLHRVKTLGEREQNWEAWSCFLHYLPFKENSFLSYPFSFSFYLFITAHNGHSCTAREYFILYLSSFSINFRIQKPTTPLQNQKRLCTFQSQKHESTRRPSNPRCPLLELSKLFPIYCTNADLYLHILWSSWDHASRWGRFWYKKFVV